MQVPAHSITILLGVVFCVINPLLAPMALVYMIIVSITEKYNLLYVQRPAYQGGGTVRDIFGTVFWAGSWCSNCL